MFNMFEFLSRKYAALSSNQRVKSNFVFENTVDGVDKFEKYAYIDWRFDQDNDYTASGLKVNSFAHTKLIVDQIRKDGFNGIVLNMNVPIDIDTGRLKLYDDRPGAFNPDKNIPRDTWAVVQYAKRLKLDVTLHFNIVDYRNDVPVMSSNVGLNFDERQFFNDVTNFQSNLAGIANRYKVDMIGIGNYQIGFDTESYKDEWKTLVDNVKSKFQGKLTYATDARSTTPIFELVDVISIGQGTQNPDKALVLQHAQRLENKYYKDVIWSPIAVSSINDGIDPWSMLVNNQDLNSIPISKDLQANTLRDIIKASIYDGNDGLSGIAFYEYSPWKQASWIQDPKDAVGKQWNLFNKMGSEFYNNDTTSDIFNNWFNYSTKPIVGNFFSNRLETFAGNKLIDGRGGIDTLTIHNDIENCKIVKDNINGGFDVYNGINGIDGIYDMYNVEYVKFNDATVSLIGQYDLAQYGWF
jgi:hypothetical protein